MIKYLSTSCIIFFTIMSFIFCDCTFSQAKDNYFSGPVFSLKAGFHTGDYSKYPSPLDQSFPGGFSIDVTGEATNLKGFSVGLNFDISFAKDIVYDSFNDLNLNRTFTNFNITSFIKYRLIIKNKAIYLGVGIGYSRMVVSFNKQWNDIKDGMLSANARLGFDYAFKNGLIISAEGVAHGMYEFKWGGGGRDNEMFQFKLGVGYVFRLP